MNKYSLISFLFLFLLVSSSSAAVYKGQKVFVRKCLECHDKGQAFVALKTQDEWEELMEDKGEPLKELHLEDDEAEDSWNYFKSKKYTKKAKHLEDFLMEYASDSGNVPACN